jgi:hypothetical protein
LPQVAIQPPVPPAAQSPSWADCGAAAAALIPSDANPFETQGNALSLADLAAEARAAQIGAEVASSLTQVGRPPNSMRLPFPGTSGPPSIYGWRAVQTLTAEGFEVAGQTAGAVATVIDATNAGADFQSGNNFQGTLDATSALGGVALLYNFAAAAPVAIPAIISAKLLVPAARLNAQSMCMMGPGSVPPPGPPF